MATIMSSKERKSEERALIERAKTDLDAFGHLYESHVDRIYNYCFHRVGNHQDAEDLASRTFQRAVEHIGRYEDRGAPFSAWLYRIAHNLVVNFHRDRSRHQERLISLRSLGSRPIFDESPITDGSNEEQAALNRAIRRLPADRQLLLVLKHSEELPNAQIGRIMGRSEGGIKSLYHRTLIALRRDMKEQGFTR